MSHLVASMSQRRWKEDGWGFLKRTSSERPVLMVESDGAFLAENSGEGMPEIGGRNPTTENAARLPGRGCGLCKGS